MDADNSSLLRAAMAIHCHYCDAPVLRSTFESDATLASTTCPQCGRTLTMAVRTLRRLAEGRR